LPFTHTTGIVERGIRKIEKVIQPLTPSERKAKDDRALSPAEAVEEELEGRCGLVVFTPWVKVGNHVASEIIPPQILPDSRGPVVVPTLTAAELKSYSLPPDPSYQPRQEDIDSPYPPFDPRKDAIRVLVEPGTAKILEEYVGMGVMATWVQIARKEQPGDDVPAEKNIWVKKKGKAPPRGGPGKNGQPTQFWYMEKVGFTVPSYHTDKYYANQDIEEN
jgi:hypothetical protein